MCVSLLHSISPNSLNLYNTIKKRERVSLEDVIMYIFIYSSITSMRRVSNAGGGRETQPAQSFSSSSSSSSSLEYPRK